MKRTKLLNRKATIAIITVAFILVTLSLLGYKINSNYQRAEAEQLAQLRHSQASSEYDEMVKRASIINDAIDEKRDQIKSFLGANPEVGEDQKPLMNLEISNDELTDLIIEIPPKPKTTDLIIIKTSEIEQYVKELDATVLSKDTSMLEKGGYIPNEGTVLFNAFSLVDERFESAKKAVEAEKKKLASEKKRIAEERKRAEEEAAHKQTNNDAVQTLMTRLVGGKFVIDQYLNAEIEFVSDTTIMIYSGGASGRIDKATATYYISTDDGSGATRVFKISMSEGLNIRNGKTGQYEPLNGTLILRANPVDSPDTITSLV